MLQNNMVSSQYVKSTKTLKIDRSHFNCLGLDLPGWFAQTHTVSVHSTLRINLTP